MRSFKWLRFGAVIAVTVAVLLLLDYMLYPCTFVRCDIHAVTSETYDDVYMGTSHGKIDIDPDSMEEVTGRSGHNLCVGGEYPQDCLYLLRLMIEKGHKPKRLVYEISPGYLMREKEEGNNYLLFYHEFPVSRTKLSYFFREIAKCNFRMLFFPWYEYPLSGELANIGKTVKTKWNKDYSADQFQSDSQKYYESGFIARYPVDPSELTMEDATEPSLNEHVQENLNQVRELIRLCEKEGIEFVSVTTPVPLPALQEYAQQYQEFWAVLDQFFQEEGVSWLNYNSSELFGMFTHDVMAYTDMDGHMNDSAARAFSRVLAGQLENVFSSGT